MKVPVLENGFSKKTRNAIMLQNTELFDAVFHIVLCLMADDDSRKKSFLKNANIELKNFVESCFKRGSNQSTYLARTKVLQHLKSIEIVDSMKVLDCQTLSLEDIIQKIISPVWPSSIKTEICGCGEKQTKLGFLNIDLDPKKRENVFVLEELMHSCISCSEEKLQFDKINDIVFVKLNEIECTCFEQIAQVICIQNEIYTLSALLVQTNELHFVSHIKRGEMWYRFDNNVSLSKSILKNKNIFPFLLVYVRPTLEESKKLLLNDVTLLKNFHKFTVDGKKYEVNNVCGPDSLIHSLFCIFRDMPQLLTNKQEENKLILLFISYLNNDMNAVYRYRIEILKSIFKPEKIRNNFQIDCKSNTYNLVKDIFMDTFPSSHLKCDCGFYIKNPFVELNYDYLVENGIEKLENALYKSKRACQDCKLKMTNYEFNDIIFVDIQPTDRISIIAPLSALPSQIAIEHCRFRLRSAIDFKNDHYTAYCLRKDNTWYHFDDLNQTVYTPEQSKRISAHTLIYVRV